MSTITLAVVDGDTNADVYGYASSAQEAKVIADRCFVDGCGHVERYGPVGLWNGVTLDEAWVAFTKAWKKTG